MPAPATILISL